jgi:2-polyprenyl-6-methoxyphenol hydroxylase-like FAD-dependent oxidoreductase
LFQTDGAPVSTHLVHPPGIAALHRWGLLDRLVATGCPPIGKYSFDFGPFAISGDPGSDQAPVAYSPRRTVLDKLLVDAASEAGAEVREGFTVGDIVFEYGRVTGVRGHCRGGLTVTERARVVIGADGLHSLVARAVAAASYCEKPQLQVSYYSDRVRAATREERFVGTGVPNFFRKPFGAGWALVGDAGYNKDFITAQGIHDAFRDAELCATALD